MPRIPYADEQTVPHEVVEPICARRGGKLLNLDRMLLHSPAYARDWNALLGAVRRELTLPPRLRELAICAVASLTGAEYEWRQHGPELLVSFKGQMIAGAIEIR
jgi:alkylhydroperoxidase family enzyme